MFVTLLEPLVDRESIRLVDLLTAGLVAIGLIIVSPKLDAGDLQTRGVFLGALSGALFAVISLINKHEVRSTSPAVLGFYQYVFMVLCSLPFFLTSGVTLSGNSLAHLAFMGSCLHSARTHAVCG